MNSLPVAVIDSGIIENAFYFPHEIHQIEIVKHRWVKHNTKDSIRSHGTVVSAILSKYAPDVEIYSVRIFYGESLSTDCKSLVQALSWCYHHKIPLINLSLGTTEKRDFAKVERIVSKMTAQGQIIVSAYHTNGSVTMPASHPDVIGVRTSSELSGNSFYPDYSHGKHDFIASSQHQLTTEFSHISFQTELSSSYAVPTVTAALANCMLEHARGNQHDYIELVKTKAHKQVNHLMR